ncbi:helix-turn-helix domain-containing protein [Schleiferilactobacillus perolens]|jgi:Rgg/GadR/MutR family transcriptional activator|uniref:helix-turn-helix domain-containing protein n=1 Tax=Schleiferilactobacillus perolens TaxID=100468 RepID=UPI002355D717|nr:hypothetical protein [Schleiferilactobacillus perolens]MCI2172051.1 hypothetical protein [Schleiferilactobacillus perolens]
MNYGALIRRIRQAKHVRLTDLADDQLSEALLSRFERGQTDMTLNKFIHLLTRLHVTPDEFIAHTEQHEDGHEPYANNGAFFGHFPSFFFRLEASGHLEEPHKVLREAEYLLQITEKEYRASPTRWHLISLRGAQLHLRRAKQHLDPQYMTTIDFTPVKEYLLNLDMWTSVDMWVYAYFLTQLDDDANHLILQAAAKHIPNHATVSSWRDVLFPVGEAQFVTFMSHHRLEYARDALDVLNKIKTNLRPQEAMNAEVRLNFLTGWLNLDQGADRQTALRQMDDAISIFSILHYDWETRYYSSLKAKITGKDPTPIEPDIFI